MPFRSGERLKAITLADPGGNRTFYGFWDAQLEHYCAFEPTPDGSMRCLPIARAQWRESDDSCDEDRVIYPDSCSPTLVAIDEGRISWCSGMGGGTVFAPYQLGSPADGETCPQPGHSVSLDPEPLPLSAFVRAEIEVVEVVEVDGPAVEILAGEEGSRLARALRLSRDGPRCVTESYTAFPDRCVPDVGSSEAFGPFFAGPGCTQPIGIAPSCWSPEYVVLEGAVHLAGPAGAAGSFFGFDCQPQTTLDDFVPYPLGPEVPVESLPEVSKVSIGDPATDWIVDASGTVLMRPPPVAAGIYRSGSEGCEVVLRSGEIVCAPDSAVRIRDDGFFADAACAEQAFESEVAHGYVALEDLCSTGDLTEVVEYERIGTIPTGSPLYTLDQGQCTPGPHQGGFSRYAVAASSPWTPMTMDGW